MQNIRLYSGSIMTDTLLILAGGKSSRMKKSTEAVGLSKADVVAANSSIKGMITINQRPFMDYIIYNAHNAGISKVIILTGEESDALRKYYGTQDRDNDFHGLKLSYATQYIPKNRQKPFGTADAVFQAMEQVESLQKSAFLMCNCDNLYSEEGFRKLIHLKVSNGWLNYDRSGLDFPREKIKAFAITSVGKKGFLKKIIEKPTEKEVAKYSDENGVVRVSMNIFKFDGNMLYDYVKNCPVNSDRNEKELQTAINNMVADHEQSMYGIPVCEHVPDLTRKEDILKVRNYLKNNFVNW
jgi:glucose-1-phosphate adenylyltransferase